MDKKKIIYLSLCFFPEWLKLLQLTEILLQYNLDTKFFQFSKDAKKPRFSCNNYLKVRAR